MAHATARNTVHDETGSDFTLWWREHYPRMVAYAAAATGADRETARDLAQEILVKVHLGMPSFDRSRCLRTWMFAVARNHVRDWFRRESRRMKHEVPLHPDNEVPDMVSADPPDVLEDGELRRQVGVYIDHLPNKRREIAYLRFFEDLPHAEIAAIVGIPEGTVRYEVHKIRESLRNFLEE